MLNSLGGLKKITILNLSPPWNSFYLWHREGKKQTSLGCSSCTGADAPLTDNGSFHHELKASQPNTSSTSLPRRLQGKHPGAVHVCCK